MGGGEDVGGLCDPRSPQIVEWGALWGGHLEPFFHWEPRGEEAQGDAGASPCLGEPPKSPWVASVSPTSATAPL